VILLVAAAELMALQAAEFRDLFADRETVVTEAGDLSGNNSGATFEAEEPRHGGKRGGHSLWLSWVAPTNGLATFELEGTGFDTLLGVYVVEPGDDPELRRLEKIADNDDDRDQTSSLLEFGVRAGQRYEIAVDGFAGATGAVRLRWRLEAVGALIPSISLVNTDRATTVGESITLAVNVGPGDEPKLHWFFNEEELEEQEDLTLVIPNFQPSNVGQYRVRVEVGDVEFFSEAVELQISSEGIINALARNKPEDALESGLTGGGAPAANLTARTARVRPAGGPSGLTRGYNGTQIFHTVYAGRDTGEPAHCGLAGGASYWFSYIPPESGDLELDTDGSVFDTVLEVYTFAPPLLGYQNLVSVACDNDSGPNGKTSRLRIACDAGRTYLVVVDGVSGARGLTYLNYRLATNSVPARAPTIRQPLQSITAKLGERALLAVLADGTPPLQFRWRKDGAEQTGQTNPELALDPVGLDHAGNYEVEVFNTVGSVTNPPVSVSVWGQLSLVLDPTGQRAELQFSAAGPLNFVVEASPEIGASLWTAPGPVIRAADGRVSVPIDLEAALTQFFRLRFP